MKKEVVMVNIMIKNKDLLKKIKRIESKLAKKVIKAIDPTTPKGYKELCKRYAEAVTPGLEAVDRHQAWSYGQIVTKAVRS